MKKIIPVAFLLLISLLFSGCQTIRLLALGSHPMPVMHEPRLDKSDREEKILSANLHGAISDSTPNTKDLTGGGASANFTYRAGDQISWLFVNIAVSASYGKLKLTCLEGLCDEDYNVDYQAIVNQKRSYSFGSIQEGARIGIEVTPGFLTMGFSGGVHLYQDFGQYEIMRDSLKRDKLIEGNSYRGLLPEARLWLGVRLGRSGELGTINTETLMQFNTGSVDNIIRYSIGYFHPSGWHGGLLAAGSAFSFTAGKSFSF